MEAPNASPAAALGCAGATSAAQLPALPSVVPGSYSMAAAGQAQAAADSMAAGTRLKRKLMARPAVRRVTDALCAARSACNDTHDVASAVSGDECGQGHVLG